MAPMGTQCTPAFQIANRPENRAPAAIPVISPGPYLGTKRKRERRGERREEGGERGERRRRIVLAREVGGGRGGGMEYT